MCPDRFLPLCAQSHMLHRYADDHSKDAISGTGVVLHHIVTLLSIGCNWLKMGIYS